MMNETVIRSWGNYQVIYNTTVDNGKVKIKVMTIKPHSSISVQYHNHRAEDWLVIQGTGDYLLGTDNGNLTGTIYPGDSLIIKEKQVHCIYNRTDKDLIIVETQTGDYLEEDDIVRI